MNKTRFYYPKQFLWIGLLLLLLLLTACLGGGNNAAQDEAAQEAATQANGALTCSEGCQSAGQCGTTADGRTLILAHNGQPMTRDHNITLLNGSAVFIADRQQRTVIDATGVTFPLDFTAVQLADGSGAGWVVASCVNETIQQ